MRFYTENRQIEKSEFPATVQARYNWDILGVLGKWGSFLEDKSAGALIWPINYNWGMHGLHFYFRMCFHGRDRDKYKQPCDRLFITYILVCL